MTSRRKWVLLLLMTATVGALIVAANYFGLQQNMNSVISSDPRNSGIDVSVHYGDYVNPSVLVYDITSVAGSDSEADVFRLFLQFAEKTQSTDFTEVDLCCKGQAKFKIRGSYFKQLGKEYSWQNPVYTTRTFPEHVMNPGGTPAYGNWEGGFLGVDLHQIQDFNDLNAKWWKSELAKP